MKRATITLPDDLETELEAYLATRDAPPSLTALMQAALRLYLEEARPGHRGSGRPGPVSTEDGPSEVAEQAAPYGAGMAGADGGAGPPPWGPGANRRLGDLPELLASLPRLSDGEVDSLAEDLASARTELSRAVDAERAERRDPWAD